MRDIPLKLYRCEQTRLLDQTAIAEGKISGFELMMRAGQAAFQELQKRWPEERTIQIFCGGGNNGGDGYIIASLALQQQFVVELYYLVDPHDLKGDAHLAYEFALQQGVIACAFEGAPIKPHGVIIDALLGTGLTGEVRPSYLSAIRWINKSGSPVLSVDIPSGLCADTGRALGAAISANTTVTFIAAKQGLFTGDAVDSVGQLVYADLGVAEDIFATQEASCQRLDFDLPLLEPRSNNSHKGLFGHVLSVGGDYGFGGAILMACESALTVGAGMVSLATRGAHVAPALTRRPEVMACEINTSEQLAAMLSRASVLLVGPGIGQSQWSVELFEACIGSQLPMVVDADGLNLLAQDHHNVEPRNNWVLTPHPAEAARLLGLSTRDIQHDRFSAARALQKKFGGTIVLKGAGTIVASESGLAVCDRGNPAMASAGMGDVLSGVIGGLLAQGLSPSEASQTGVWAHGVAGDLAAQSLGRHLVATELYPFLRQLM